MASRSSLALRTSKFTIAEATWEILAPSTSRPVIRELSVIQATATAQTLGLGRPGAVAGTPTNVLFQRDDPGDPASVVNGQITWTTTPTAPTIFLRRWNSAATIGVGIVWTWQDDGGLVVAASAGIVLWNITTSVACDVNCKIED